MIIGCVTLVPVKPQWSKDFRQVAGINCHKGRGIILPGGKWEEGQELFEEAAQREFLEETRQHLKGLPKLLWQGFTLRGNYTYCFLGECPRFQAHVKSPEGDETRYALWADLLKSDFRAYYSLLRQHIESLGYFTGEG